MSINTLPSSNAVLVGVIDPDAYGAGTVTSGWISMQDKEAIQALISVGTMAATSTLDAKIEQATDSSGTGAKDITGKAITQLTAAGTDSDKQAVINVFDSELDIVNEFDHVRLSMTVAVAASDAGAVILSQAPVYYPDTAISSLDEVV